MYITCEEPIGIPLEQSGYVPNNPLFGLPLDSPQECPTSCGGCVNCQGASSLPLSELHSSDFDCGNCLDHNGVLGLSQGSSQSNLGSNYWTEDMGTFPTLPPIDLEPLPSLFPFSPCGASYKSERPTHDMADVLLSLKHAVLKPGQESHQHYQNHQQNYGSPQSSLSYTVHPQMLVPSGHQTQNQVAPYSSGGYYESPCATPIYPSMSVNVSMNMTMHGYGSEVPMQCSQMQWTPPNSSSAVNVLYPPLLSPAAYPGSATYSFTADFRPQTSSHSSIPPMVEPVRLSPSPPQRPYYQNNMTYPPQKSPVYGNNPMKMRSSKQIGIGFDDDDSSDGMPGDNKPNLCRLCGKTYARPSTLKTHLRTHSGERPYRCPDCNKSFSQAANLTAHLRTHTGQKPFRCPICDRRFSQSSSVTTHMRTHSGERPYRCRACKKAFSDSSTLTKHLRIHSGEKPYQCKLCLLRFSQSGNLNRHMRVHSTNSNLIT